MLNRINEVKKSLVRVSDTEWHITKDNVVTAMISKNNGKYFPHWRSRQTQLQTCDNFNKAVSVLAQNI